MEFKVIVGWDEENRKFFIVESDVEGLWLEKPTFEALVDAIRDVAPDLIAHNHGTQKAPILRIFREIGAPLTLSA
ncbi:MAG: DUF1902 domain-containing protein [Vitreimonas sp.]